MTKEDEWEKALDNLREVKEAHKEGKASQSDVDKAQEEYDRLSREIGPSEE